MRQHMMLPTTQSKDKTRTWENALPPVQPPRPPVLSALRPLYDLNPIARPEVQVALRLRLEIIQRDHVLRRGLRLRLQWWGRRGSLLGERGRGSPDVGSRRRRGIRRGRASGSERGGRGRGGLLERGRGWGAAPGRARGGLSRRAPEGGRAAAGGCALALYHSRCRSKR